MRIKHYLRPICILLFSFFVFKSHAQTSKLNSFQTNYDSTLFYYSLEIDQKAIPFSNNALELAEELKNDTALINLWMIQGNIQRSNRYFWEANRKYHKVVEKSLALLDTTSLFRGLLSIGDTFIRLHDETDKHMPYLDSAAYYYNIAHNHSQTENKFTPNLYECFGHVELARKNYSKSLFYYEKSSKYYLRNHDSIAYYINATNAANAHIGLKQFKIAEKITREAIVFFKQKNIMDHLSASYFTLSWQYENERKFEKAFNYRNLFFDIQDTIFTRSNAAVIAELDKKYQSEKKDKEIAERITKENRTNFYLILSAILLGTLGILFRLYIVRNKLRQNNLTILYQEQQLLQQSRLEELENESHHKIINAALDGREEERKVIAETLHNSVSALLSSANLHLHAFKKNITEERHQQILKTQGIIMEASGKIRDLSHNLVSSLLINFGLEYAVHDICEKFTSSELEFILDSNLDHRYPVNVELKLYHIIEELCNNTLKHSKANQAEITLHQTDKELKISIQDNGIGFDTDKLLKKRTGIGLNQIEARVKNMKGIIDIDSKPLEGTIVILTLPIQTIKST